MTIWTDRSVSLNLPQAIPQLRLLHNAKLRLKLW